MLTLATNAQYYGKSDSLRIFEAIKDIAIVDSFHLYSDFKKRAPILEKVTNDWRLKNRAIQDLWRMNLVPEPALKEHQGLFIKNLKTFYYIYTSQRYMSSHVLGLLDLPHTFVDTLMADSNVPDYVKARLGNKESEQQVIDAFNIAISCDYVDLRSVKILAYHLFYINSPVSRYAVFKGLESEYIVVAREPDLEGKAEECKFSLSSFLLSNPISNNLPFDTIFLFRTRYNYPDEHAYKRAIEKYVYEKFQISITITVPYTRECVYL